MNKIKKILTLEDLIKFCEDKNFTKFNSEDSGYKLAVQIPATFDKVETKNEDDTLLYCLLKTCHIGLNRNGSYISEESMKNAMSTLKYKPILCNFTDTDEGKDFTSHDMEIDEDGNIIYLEHQVGCFTADEPYLEYDKEKDKTYVMAYAAIPRDYTDASTIIERKNGTKVSVELNINELSYNAKENYLQLDSFIFAGCTLLGVDPETGKEVGEGMEGARLDIADFSQANNSVINFSENIINNKLVETLEKLNNTLSCFKINDSNESNKTCGKEDIQVDQKDILFNEEVETMEITNKEIEALFGEDSIDENNVNIETEIEEEFTEESTKEDETEVENTDITTEEETPEVVEEDFNQTIENTENQTDNDFSLIEKNFEIDGKKFSVSFQLSHDDILYGLYNLLYVYEELDNELYGIRAVYDDYFVMQGWCNNKIYGQKYIVENDNVSFDGERWNLYEELLTESEYAELKNMRENYSTLVQFKEDTENAQLRSQKESVIYDEKYSVISEKDEDGNYINKEYAKLISEMDNYSLTDLEKELKSIFADHITNGGNFNFNEQKKPIVTKKQFASVTGDKKKPSRYGNLFKK